MPLYNPEKQFGAPITTQAKNRSDDQELHWILSV